MPLFSPRQNLRTRLARRLPEVLDQTIENLKRDVPFYQHLPAELVDHEVADVTQRNFDLFLALLREGRQPVESEIQEILHSAARRAEERIPLPEVLAAYYAGFRTGWHELLDLAENGEVKDVVEIGEQVLSYLQFVTTAVTDVYVETATALTSRERDARARLMVAVLEAEDTSEEWDDAGFTRWGDRAVLVLRYRLRRRSDPALASVAVRRRAREVRQALESLCGPELLFSFSSTGGTILLPGLVEADPLAAALGAVLRGKWYAGLAHATDRAGTPVAHEAAEACAEVPDRLGYPAGVYELRQLLVEVQVTRPGPARSALLDVLSGLDEYDDLVETLTAHVAESGRRTDTAKRLHVHPNTLDYRLKRIREITGLDPVERDGAQLLRSALIARAYLAGGQRRGQSL